MPERAECPVREGTKCHRVARALLACTVLFGVPLAGSADALECAVHLFDVMLVTPSDPPIVQGVSLSEEGSVFVESSEGEDFLRFRFEPVDAPTVVFVARRVLQ